MFVGGKIMADIIFIGLVAVLSIFGLSDIINSIKLWFLKPAVEPETCFVFLLNKENPELQLVNIGERYAWSGKGFAKNIVALYNDDISEQQLKNCIEISEKYGIKIFKESYGGKYSIFSKQ